MNKPMLQELLSLRPAEKIELIGELWDSLSENDLPPLTEDEIAELDRRMDEHERDPATAIPWEEVREWLWTRRGR